METKTVKELCELVVDCPHSTPAWTEHGKIVVRNNNIKNGWIDLSSPPSPIMSIFSSALSEPYQNPEILLSLAKHRWEKSEWFQMVLNVA